MLILQKVLRMEAVMRVNWLTEVGIYRLVEAAANPNVYDALEHRRSGVKLVTVFLLLIMLA